LTYLLTFLFLIVFFLMQTEIFLPFVDKTQDPVGKENLHPGSGKTDSVPLNNLASNILPQTAGTTSAQPQCGTMTNSLSQTATTIDFTKSCKMTGVMHRRSNSSTELTQSVATKANMVKVKIDAKINSLPLTCNTKPNLLPTNAYANNLPRTNTSAINLTQCNKTVTNAFLQSNSASNILARKAVATVKLVQTSTASSCLSKTTVSTDLVKVYSQSNNLKCGPGNYPLIKTIVTNCKPQISTVTAKSAQSLRKNSNVAKTTAMVDTLASTISSSRGLPRLDNTTARMSIGAPAPNILSTNSNLPLDTGASHLKLAASKKIDMLQATSAANESYSDSSDLEISNSDISISSEDDLPLGATAELVNEINSSPKSNKINEAFTSNRSFPRTSTPDLSARGKFRFFRDVDGFHDEILACSPAASPEVFKVQRQLVANTVEFRRQQHLLDQEIYELKKRKMSLEIQFLTDKFQLEKQMYAKRTKL